MKIQVFKKRNLNIAIMSKCSDNLYKIIDFRQNNFNPAYDFVNHEDYIIIHKNDIKKLVEENIEININVAEKIIEAAKKLKINQQENFTDEKYNFYYDIANGVSIGSDMRHIKENIENYEVFMKNIKSRRTYKIKIYI